MGRDGESPGELSRRDFLKGLGLAGGAGMVHGFLGTDARAEEKADAPDLTSHPAAGTRITLRINGTSHDLSIKPSATLLEVLREQVGLTGSKQVCDRGACGACTVLLDGRSVNSCLLLAIDAVGAEIVTVEGLGSGDRLDPLQDAFARHDACQCGYCIPGFVVRAKALLHENPHPSVDEIRLGLSGNICRCGTYPKIVQAVQDTAGRGPA